MPIKFAEKIFLRSNRVTSVHVRGKEFAMAFGVGSHRRDLALIPQDHEVALSSLKRALSSTVGSKTSNASNTL